MTHVTDELELFALHALPLTDRARVAAHLAECPACREQARLIDEVASALPDTLPQRDVPARLRSRILASARVDLAPAPAPHRRSWSAPTMWFASPSRIAIAVLSILVIGLGAVDVAGQRELRSARGESDDYGAVAQRIAHGGNSWYMAGREQWAGSGGTLYAPTKADAAPFAAFHDLKPITPGAVYALWLVDADGRWTRAANFLPNGAKAQVVTLDTPVDGFSQCAVTVELQREGKRAGPLVMQSRIAPAGQ